MLSKNFNNKKCAPKFNEKNLRVIGMIFDIEILTSNSVGTKLFFLGYNQDKNHGSNFIIKKKICLVLPEKEISNHRN